MIVHLGLLPIQSGIRHCIGGHDNKSFFCIFILILNNQRELKIISQLSFTAVGHLYVAPTRAFLSSLGSRSVQWLGEGLSMPSPNYHVLCCPLPDRVPPIFVQVVSPSFGWLPVSYGLQVRGPSVVFDLPWITSLFSHC